MSARRRAISPAIASDREDRDQGPRADPEGLARSLHERFAIHHPHEIKVELMAYHCGARVVWRDAGSADARVVKSGGTSYLAIARAAKGTPRARFSMAHELGHGLMHHDVDSLARIHGLPQRTSEDFRVEREANRFASLLLVPSFLAEPLCAASPPTLEAVGAFARAFDVSLTVGARRWAELAKVPCAVVETRGGVVRRARRSSSWRGEAVERRALEKGTLALEMGRGPESVAETRRAHAEAWGSAKLGSEIVEECVPLAPGSVLAWLWHR